MLQSTMVAGNKAKLNFQLVKIGCLIFFLAALAKINAAVPLPMSKYLELPDRSKIVRAPAGNWIWCPSLIKVDSVYHLFVSIIPNTGTWQNDSKVARYESTNMYGPYTYKGIVLQPVSGGWVTKMIHNPSITRDPISKKYIIFFIGNNVNYVGYATATNITGPWTFSSGKINVSLSNPSPCFSSDGSIYLLGRMKATVNNVLTSQIIAYKANSYNGSYTRLAPTKVNFLSNNCGVEDPWVWFVNKQYHLIGTDWAPYLTGGSKNGVQYYSDDGLTYKPVTDTALWVNQDFKFTDGTSIKKTRIERPWVYLNDKNQVTALLLALGDGGSTTISPEEKGVCIVPVKNYEPNATVQTQVKTNKQYTAVEKKPAIVRNISKSGCTNGIRYNASAKVLKVNGKQVNGTLQKGNGVYIVK